MFSPLGFDKIVEDLITKCNADINIQNKYKETPLIVAVKEGRKEIVDFLLENYAVINSQNIDGNTALHLAILNGTNSKKNLILFSLQFKDLLQFFEILQVGAWLQMY